MTLKTPIAEAPAAAETIAAEKARKMQADLTAVQRQIDEFRERLNSLEARMDCFELSLVQGSEGRGDQVPRLGNDPQGD